MIFILTAINLSAASDNDLFGNKEYIPDIDTFMQIGSASGPAISPDGKTIYLMNNFTGTGQVYRVTENDKYPYQLTFFKEGVRDYALSPDGKYAVLRVDQGGDEQYQLYLMDAHTGRVKALTASPKVRFGYPVWSPDSRTIYFQANMEKAKNFNIYRMDLATGKQELILPDEGYFNPNAVSLDGKLLLFTEWVSHDTSRLSILNLETGEKKLLTPHKDPFMFWGVSVSRDNKKVYCITNNNESGVMKISTLDIDTGKLDFFYDASSPWGVDDAALNPERTVMALAINEDGYGRLKIIDLESKDELPAPEVNGIADEMKFSSGARMVFSLNTPVSVTEVFSWNRENKKLDKITNSSYAGIDPSLFVEPKLIKYKSFDGLEIPAFLYLPPGWEKNKGNIPFVMHLHGGPESQFRPYFQRHFNYLLLNGYGILAPNIRGSSGYGKKYREMDNYKKRMDSVKDGYYGAKYLIDQGYAKKGKIAVKGGSYGGFMVMALITEYPDMWGAAVESVGIVDYVNFLKNTSSYRRKLRESEYGPLSDPEFLKSVSPIHKLDRIKTPLMVVHGANDPRVPVSEAHLIIDNLKKRDVKVEALIFADEGHGVGKRENLLLEYRKMVEFFDRNMKN